MDVPFVDRERELAALERFWTAGAAQCIPVTGRRRVGKTFLLERFATGKRVVYYRCELRGSAEQLPPFGAALAGATDDPLIRAQPPTSWPAVFALIERLAAPGGCASEFRELGFGEGVVHSSRRGRAHGLAAGPRRPKN